MAGIVNAPPQVNNANENNPQAPGGGQGRGRGRGRGNRGNRGRAAAAQGGNAGANPGRGGQNNSNSNGVPRGGNRGGRGRGRGAVTNGPQQARGRGAGRGGGGGNHNGPPTSVPNCAPHPNGQYWIRVRDVANVHGDSIQVPLRCYPKRIKGQNDWVSMDDVDQASDQYDGESIMHEIDTGFGICPGGGLLEVSGYGSD